MCIKNEELCIKNEELCIKNEELCIENEELCIENDGFCSELNGTRPLALDSNVAEEWEAAVAQVQLNAPDQPLLMYCCCCF